MRQKGIKIHNINKIEKKEDFMKKSKERPLTRPNQGITLIALVITIIVLLILASVSLNLIAGSDGMLKKASTAKERTEIATAKELANLDILEWKTDKMEKGESTVLNDAVIKEILTGKSYVKDAPGETSFRTKEGGYEILYTEFYKAGKISFTINALREEDGGTFEVEEGTTWNEFMSEKFPNNSTKWCYNDEGIVMEFGSESGAGAIFYKLTFSDNSYVNKDDMVKTGDYKIGNESVYVRELGRDVFTFGS